MSKVTIEELKKQILDIINRRMREYSNRALNRRRNAFDELYELEREIEKLK